MIESLRFADSREAVDAWSVPSTRIFVGVERMSESWRVRFTFAFSGSRSFADCTPLRTAK